MEANKEESNSNLQCCICKVEKAKYLCPACGSRTCSLRCFNRHKMQLNCPGKSDVTLNRTRYVPKDKLGSNNIQRDYNFLMKVNRELQLGREDATANRIPTNQTRRNRRPYQRGRNGYKRMRNDRHTFTDTKNIIRKGGARIKELPIGMERQTKNRSGYNPQRGKFVWTVEWILMGKEFESIDKCLEYKSDEDQMLCDLLPLKKFEKLTEQVKEEEDSLKQKLHYFISTFDARNKLIELSSNLALKEAVKNRLLLEFPTIYISLFDQFTGNSKTVVPIDTGKKLLSKPSILSYSSSSSDSDSESDSGPPEEGSARVANSEPNDSDYCPSANYIP